jgi:hypothetical protein
LKPILKSIINKLLPMARGKQVVHCDSCGGEMKQEKAGKVRVDGGAMCRIRRYHCELCNVNKTIYGNGQWDEEAVPYYAVEAANKLAKQQGDYDKNFM